MSTANFKIHVGTWSLVLLLVFSSMCASAPDSSDKSHPSRLEVSKVEGRDSKQLRKVGVKSDETADGAFCMKAQGECLEACSRDGCSTQDTQDCVKTCNDASGQCCRCSPTWTLDGRTVPDRALLSTKLTSKNIRNNWDWMTPTQLCVSNFSKCVATCGETSVDPENPCITSCIQNCLNNLGSCCNC